jgi:hypothetical protein
MPCWFGDGMVKHVPNPLIKGKVCENFAHVRGKQPNSIINTLQSPLLSGAF